MIMARVLFAFVEHRAYGHEMSQAVIRRQYAIGCCLATFGCYGDTQAENGVTVIDYCIWYRIRRHTHLHGVYATSREINDTELIALVWRCRYNIRERYQIGVTTGLRL